MAPRKPAAELRPAGIGLRRSARVPGENTHAADIAPTANASAITTNKDTHRAAKSRSAKPKPQIYHCTSCTRTLAASSFPEYLPTDTCQGKHLINTCKSCLKAWIATQMEMTTYDKIRCPECPELMQNGDVKIHGTKKCWEQFDGLERRGIAEKVKGWRWCLAPKCKAGQVHEPLLEQINADTVTTKSTRGKARPRTKSTKKTKNKHKKSSDDTPDIFTCNTCSARACVPCDRPFHEGETCAQYQHRMKTADEKASLEKIEEACTQCGTQFCWLCSTTYTVVNRQGHAKGCTYALPGRIDPHAMHVANGGAGAGAAVGPGAGAGFFGGMLLNVLGGGNANGNGNR
ncbi:hypothetical protein LTR37_005716 [Vermiconidia calcicola]|uniref:Uncharacterized protein n=1 Tax=Vermiconidia calcicola TaxID=1690605 RepID=A0ACC3NID9_9PEZI|nr:hypothetical protein LTR37_005716 [Vermiconidia calcicola]